MSTHRYPRAALRADYFRAGSGLVLTVGPLFAAGGEPISSAILGSGAMLFLAFGLRTWHRHSLAIELDQDGISTSGSRYVTLPWHELTAVTLRYYATKRDRTGGWMQLNLSAGRARLAIESTLEGFGEVARVAAVAAVANGIEFDDATRNNLRALGIDPALRPA